MEEVKRFTLPVGRCYAAVMRASDGRLYVMVQDTDFLSQWPHQIKQDGRNVYLYDRPHRVAGYAERLVGRAFAYKRKLEEEGKNLIQAKTSDKRRSLRDERLIVRTALGDEYVITTSAEGALLISSLKIGGEVRVIQVGNDFIVVHQPK